MERQSNLRTALLTGASMLAVATWSATAAQAAGIETVVVTAEKKRENIQTVPIAISAFTQKQLTERQIAGGPDLVKEVPNLTFTKTNFTGYSIQIRGIGTQAISVTTDPAVAVAFNDTPFLRNHFFEQEFYDLENVQILRGPQGTLFGRNATAGVVNIVSAKPVDHFEAMMSADFGNYSNRRYEGMINIPIVGDKLMLRLAGEWTKRDGYTYDSSLHSQVDGRDLWSGRVSLRWKPTDNITADLIWEHFQESDDRVRSAKQLCKKDPGPTSVDGLDLSTLPTYTGGGLPADFNAKYAQTWLSQGCLPTSFYSNDAFDTPNGQVIPFVAVGEFYYGGGDNAFGRLLNTIDPYANQTQSHDLRTIESLIKPAYRAKNDTLEFNVNYQITPSLTLTSETGYNKDFLWSTEDFNRFDTAPGLFANGFSIYGGIGPVYADGTYCDPQLGCSSAMVAQDLSREHAWQFSQEIRLASDFNGPLNFSVGANYLHYQTNEDYFVFFNVLSALTQITNGQSPGDYTHCVPTSAAPPFPITPKPFFVNVGGVGQGGFSSQFGCVDTRIFDSAPGTYIDPNPIPQLDGQGHNYFRSENPYHVSSYAGFGEVYYQLTPDLKLTGGLRWTDDQKTFWQIPSWVYMLGGGYPVLGVVRQEWHQLTGRSVITWTPKLDFTDQTMVYASYSRGYKAGGANPPLPAVNFLSSQTSVVHPATFDPEFVNAYELGTKNTLLDGNLILNADAFFYDYKGYQISKIVDRTSINENVDAKIWGTELQIDYSPLPGLKFGFNGGYENTRINNGQSSIDLMDRTAGHSDWAVVRPFITDTSNCILPAYVVKAILQANSVGNPPDIFGGDISGACDAAYHPGGFLGLVGSNAALQNIFNNVGFDPSTAPNNGEGFAKPLGGNELPNAPHYTLSLTADYTMPVSSNWAATLHTDFYWQSQSWARIWNDPNYDKLHGYSNVNLALILTDATGWQIMGYVKNVFNTTAITGAFLNSDDTALTTNVFTTDPRLYGVRITKRFGEGNWENGGGLDFIPDFFADADGKRPPVWISVDGQLAMQKNDLQIYDPSFLASSQFNPDLGLEKAPKVMWNRGAEISFQPNDSNWTFSAAIHYGKIGRSERTLQQTTTPDVLFYGFELIYPAYQDYRTQSHESHTILDFQIGRDVGLGGLNVFGDDTTSVVSAGVRYAQFRSTDHVGIASQPTNCASECPYNRFYASMDASRSFHGIGPSLSWKASTMVMGDRSDGGISLDWGVNGAVLFGRQKTSEHHQTTELHHNYANGFRGLPRTSTVYQTSASPIRSRSVTIPNLGGFAAVSWRYANAKVSFGYKADFFFGAIDGGLGAEHREDRGFYGPFASVSIGLGG